MEKYRYNPEKQNDVSKIRDFINKAIADLETKLKLFPELRNKPYNFELFQQKWLNLSPLSESVNNQFCNFMQREAKTPGDLVNVLKVFLTTLLNPEERTQVLLQVNDKPNFFKELYTDLMLVKVNIGDLLTISSFIDSNDEKTLESFACEFDNDRIYNILENMLQNIKSKFPLNEKFNLVLEDATDSTKYKSKVIAQRLEQIRNETTANQNLKLILRNFFHFLSEMGQFHNNALEISTPSEGVKVSFGNLNAITMQPHTNTNEGSKSSADLPTMLTRKEGITTNELSRDIILQEIRNLIGDEEI